MFNSAWSATNHVLSLVVVVIFFGLSVSRDLSFASPQCCVQLECTLVPSECTLVRAFMLPMFACIASLTWILRCCCAAWHRCETLSILLSGLLFSHGRVHSVNLIGTPVPALADAPPVSPATTSHYSIDDHLSTLVVKLQLLTQSSSKSIDEHSTKLIAELPRAMADIERVGADSSLLASQMAQVLDKVSEVERSGQQTVAALATLDAVKTRMEECALMLSEAESVSKILIQLEPLFQKDELREIAARLGSLRRSLESMGQIEEFSDAAAKLKDFEDRLEKRMSSKLKEAIEHVSIQESHIHPQKSPMRAHAYPHKSHTYPQKSHTYPKKSHTYPRKNHTFPQKSHIYPQKSHTYPHKSHTYPQKSHSYPQKSLICVHRFAAKPCEFRQCADV